jgi:hypothetical protein
VEIVKKIELTDLKDGVKIKMLWKDGNYLIGIVGWIDDKHVNFLRIINASEMIVDNYKNMDGTFPLHAWNFEIKEGFADFYELTDAEFLGFQL